MTGRMYLTFPQIAKVGSSSLRAWMTRAEDHVRVFAPDQERWLCSATDRTPMGADLVAEERDGLVAAPCVVANRSVAIGGLADGFLRCERVLTLPSSGFGPLTCRTLVILRNPLQRIRSEYEYFCLGCRDDDKFCGRLHKDTGCPHNRSLVQWAARAPNLYVRHFGSTWPDRTFTTRDVMTRWLAGFADMPRLDKTDMDAAFKLLTRRNTLVLYTDELDDPARGFARVVDFVADLMPAAVVRGLNATLRSVVRVNAFGADALPPALRVKVEAASTAQWAAVAALNRLDCVLVTRLRSVRDSCAF